MKAGKEIFQTCCDELGINFEEVFCYGRGNTYYSKGKRNPRYEFKPTIDQLLPNHKYALKYFKTEEMFLCWDLDSIPKRSIFSADKDEALNTLELLKSSFKKGIEFSFGEKEDVYVITKESAMDFLKFLKERL